MLHEVYKRAPFDGKEEWEEEEEGEGEEEGAGEGMLHKVGRVTYSSHVDHIIPAPILKIFSFWFAKEYV